MGSMGMGMGMGTEEMVGLVTPLERLVSWLAWIGSTTQMDFTSISD